MQLFNILQKIKPITNVMSIERPEESGTTSSIFLLKNLEIGHQFRKCIMDPVEGKFQDSMRPYVLQELSGIHNPDTRFIIERNIGGYGRPEEILSNALYFHKRIMDKDDDFFKKVTDQEFNIIVGYFPFTNNLPATVFVRYKPKTLKAEKKVSFKLRQIDVWKKSEIIYALARS